MRIQVMQEHIDRARELELANSRIYLANRCPIALAARDAGLYRASVAWGLMRRRALLVAAALVAAASLTSCGDSKPITCAEGQHVEDQGYYALLPQWILGANGTMTMITTPVWQSNPVCVKND